MNKIPVSLISAIDKDSRSIGNENGGLPWRIPEDFKYFRKITTGHPVIMGRTTWEEFRGKPLPNRDHIIITRDQNYKATDHSGPEKILIVHSIEEALEKAREVENSKDKSDSEKEIFVIGGAQIYNLALPYADRLYLTLVSAGIDTPVKFPDYKTADFTKVVSSKKSSDENFEYEFVVLEK